MSTPMQHIDTPVPDSSQFDFNKYLPAGQTFDQLVADLRQLQEFVKTSEEQISAKKMLLFNALRVLNVRRVIWQKDYLVYEKVGNQPRKTIDPQMLLDNGVSAEQIQKSIKYGKAGSPTIVVQKLKNGKVEEYE